MKSINLMTRKEFEEVPRRKTWNEDVGKFDTFVILPRRTLLDLGYRNLDFILCRGDKPYVKVGGCSDVVHLNRKDNQTINIDCLAKSGLLHVFMHEKLTCDADLSSMFIKS